MATSFRLVLDSAGRKWFALTSTLVWAAVLLAASAELIPGRMGAGLAIAYCLAHGAHAVLLGAYTSFVIPGSPVLSHWPLLVGATGLLTAAAALALRDPPAAVPLGLALAFVAAVPGLRAARGQYRGRAARGGSPT